MLIVYVSAVPVESVDWLSVVTWYLQARDAPIRDLDLAGDEAGRAGLDRKDFVGQEGLSGVVLGCEAACGGTETWKTDEGDGTWTAGLGHAVTTTDGNRSTWEADFVDHARYCASHFQRLLFLAETWQHHQQISLNHECIKFEALYQ